jgi:hypothetical protein
MRTPGKRPNRAAELLAEAESGVPNGRNVIKAGFVTRNAFFAAGQVTGDVSRGISFNRFKRSSAPAHCFREGGFVRRIRRDSRARREAYNLWYSAS